MKIEENPVNIQRNGPMIESAFGISEGNESHILHILRDKLYSDKIGAVVREYSTNALDSHVEAGKEDVPIQIKLPSQLEPMFRIIDNGIGLSEDDVRNIYVQYGASTKRNSNEVIGQLGLGCKSAFAYTDNFNIVSRKDGEKKTYSAYLDESKCGKVALLHEEDTIEENGVEIQIPVMPQDFSNFEDKVRDKLKFMKPAPEIDGEILQHSYDFDFETFANGLRICTHDNVTSHVVMGSIAYPFYFNEVYDNSSVKEETKDLIHPLRNKSFDLYVNIGDVDISANREALEYTAKTCITIANGLVGVSEEIKTKIEAEINACNTLKEAKEYYILKYDTLKNYNFKIQFWKGIQLSSDVMRSSFTDSNEVIMNDDGSCSRVLNTCLIYGASVFHHRSSYNSSNLIDVPHNYYTKQPFKCLFFNIDNTSAWKSKISRWLRQNGHTYNDILYEACYAINFGSEDIRKRFFKEYHLDDYDWINVSDLKISKTISGTSYSKNASHHGKMFRLKNDTRRITNPLSTNWEKVTDEIEKGRKYYVELDRFKVKDNEGVTVSIIDDLLRLLNRRGRKIDPNDIIGIKTASMKHKRPGWIPFLKFARKVLDNDPEILRFMRAKNKAPDSRSSSFIKDNSDLLGSIENKNGFFYKTFRLAERLQKEYKELLAMLPVDSYDLTRIFRIADIQLDIELYRDNNPIQHLEMIKEEYPLLTDSMFPNRSYYVAKEVVQKRIISYVNMHDYYKQNKRKKNELSIHPKRQTYNNNYRRKAKGNPERRRELWSSSSSY